MMGFILSLNMYSSDQMFPFANLSTMNVEPPESNKICSMNYSHEESMWRIISFDTLQQTKSLFVVLHLGVFFFAFKLVFNNFGLYLLVFIFCL